MEWRPSYHYISNIPHNFLLRLKTFKTRLGKWRPSKHYISNIPHNFLHRHETFKTWLGKSSNIPHNFLLRHKAFKTWLGKWRPSNHYISNIPHNFPRRLKSLLQSNITQKPQQTEKEITVKIVHFFQPKYWNISLFLIFDHSKLAEKSKLA